MSLPGGSPLAGDELAAVISVASDDEFGRSAIVVISAATGEVVRTLVGGFDSVEGGVFRMTLTPDRRTVVYTRRHLGLHQPGRGGGGRRIIGADGRVRAGQHRGVLARRRTMAIDVGDECVGAVVIDFVPVAGGPTIRYEADPGTTGTIESMVFSGARSVTYIDTAQAAPGPVYVVDFGDGTARVAVADGNRRLTNLAAMGGEVTALESCCDETGGASTSLVTLDGLEVRQRRAVEVGDIRTVAFIGLDRSGALVITDAAELSIDGRTRRRGRRPGRPDLSRLNSRNDRRVRRPDG